MTIYRSISIIVFLSLFFFYSCGLFNSPRHIEDQKVTGWAVNDQGDSVYVQYSDDGRLQSSTTFRSGTRSGIAKKFYDDGTLQFEIMYKDGTKEGITKYYYQSGNLYRETNYVEGQEDGIQKKYYENGNLMAEIPYSKGRVIPGLKEYTKSGKLKTIYPDLIIEPVNKLAFENKYILRCYLEGKPKGTDYYKVMKVKNSDREPLIRLEEKNGAADIEFYVRPGGFVMEKVKVRAEYKTPLRNIYVVEKEYNLALDY